MTTHSDNMLEFISFIADHGVEFAARRLTCDSPTCDHHCAYQGEGYEDTPCANTAIWTILLPTNDGVAVADFCGEHAALLLLAAEELMEEVDSE